jgi:oxygen-independent coproporphyrinogen-3 oxidase
MTKLKHLYIHIPFCKNICTYCDFKRFVSNENEMTEYIQHVVQELKHKYKQNKFMTIYIGGGTPNFLSTANLKYLLSNISPYLLPKAEFTIECNPEFVNKEQCKLFKLYKVNRISLGVQSQNQKILKLFHRNHTNQNVIDAIKNLRLSGIYNISVDFIYGFNEYTNNDIKQDILFLSRNKIPHVSFYSLEVKPGSIIYKQKYHTNDEHIENQFKYIINTLEKNKFHRYEISS